MQKFADEILYPIGLILAAGSVCLGLLLALFACLGA